jgi:hypothetical protein
MNFAVDGASPMLEGDASCEGSPTIILIVDGASPNVFIEDVRELFLEHNSINKVTETKSEGGEHGLVKFMRT